MSIGTRNDKSYLEIEGRAAGFRITARKKHAAELERLLRQYGVPCVYEAGLESDTLVFDSAADRGKVEEVLTAYEAARGS
jgi:hypothetical protein